MQGKGPLGNGVDPETRKENTATDPRGSRGKIGATINPNRFQRVKEGKKEQTITGEGV